MCSSSTARTRFRLRISKRQTRTNGRKTLLPAFEPLPLLVPCALDLQDVSPAQANHRERASVIPNLAPGGRLLGFAAEVKVGVKPKFLRPDFIYQKRCDSLSDFPKLAWPTRLIRQTIYGRK
jgi:hypothetical protein